MTGSATKTRIPPARALFAAAGLVGVAAISLATVLAAARGHSFLSPSLHRHPPSWLLWPFGALWREAKQPRMHLEYELLGALVAMLACWVLASAYARFLPRRLVWGAVALVYLAFFLSSPLLLTDVFNYIGYAREGVLHHLDPYTALPLAIKHAPVFRFDNWHHLGSPYAP